MDDLTTYREAINAIDEQLMHLFEQRMQQVAGVAQYKQERGLPIFQKAREAEVIAKNKARIQDEALIPYAEVFLQHMMDLSKDYQCKKIALQELPLTKGDITVGFQGVSGSFSEEALLQYFGTRYQTQHYKSFEEVFEALKYEEITYGVVPIENSTAGSIPQIYDLLKQYGYAIVGETYLKIEQHLLGLENAEISKLTHIYSHTQGLEQCSKYLSGLQSCEQIAYHNTAISARYVKESGDTTKAAIGSKRAAELYGLECLAENIANTKENITRFVIVGKHSESNALCDKMTIVFTLPNETGRLKSILDIFASTGINLAKIESRPVGDGSFSYFFYMDVEANYEDVKLKEAMNAVQHLTEGLRYLGCYKHDNHRVNE